MFKKSSVLAVAVLIAVVAVAAVACGDDDDSTGGSATIAINDTPVAVISVQIVSPENGSTVSSPVTFEVVAEGAIIAPADDDVQGAAHYARAVDGAAGALVTGQVVARGSEAEGIYQYAAGSVEVEMTPGEHTVVIGVADNDDLLLSGVELAEVTFTVSE